MQRTVNPLLHRSTLGAALALAAVAGISMPSPAEAEKPVLSAQQSDPVRMGWMQGFPPLKDRQLRFADGSFFEFPAMRWSVVHMSEFMPVVSVSRGLRAPRRGAAIARRSSPAGRLRYASPFSSSHGSTR